MFRDNLRGLTFLIVCLVFIYPTVGISQASQDNRELRRAANAGNSEAQFTLAKNYTLGRGLRKNLQNALFWYRKAANNGHVQAQNDLGKMHYLGTGVRKDYNLAAKWYRLAAQKGNIKAQSNLALMYFAGYGVKANYAQAYVWANFAAARGDRKAHRFRKLLKKKMSTKQHIRAAGMVDNYLSQYNDIFDSP